MEAIGRTFKPLWRARNEFKIREAGDHVLLFIFELESDAERVLSQQPWSFDKHLVLFQRYDYKTPAKHLRFTKAKFWVQIHGLPMRLLDPETAVELGESLGEVSEMENPKELVGNDFVRVKVEVDISKPLRRGCKIEIEEDSERWVSFKYEKLPNFCYWCGLVSHDEKDCEKRFMNRSSGLEEKQGYGAWLRATPYNPGKSSYTTVPGMGDGLGGLDGSNIMKQPVKPRKESLVDTQDASQTQASKESRSSADLHELPNMDIAENRDIPQ